MVMKTKGIPSCTGTPGQPPFFGHNRSQTQALKMRETRVPSGECLELLKKDQSGHPNL